jgi:hypothetical protein
VDGEIILAIIAALTAFLGGATKLVHWAVTRIAKSHDDAATKSCAAQDRATDAIIKNTEITTKLVTKLDHMDGKLDEIRGVKSKKRARTDPGGLRIVPESE